MSNKTTQHAERQLEAVANRLERLEATIATILDFLTLRGPDILAKFPGSSLAAHSDLLPGLEPVERAAPPWSYLVSRRHPWRQQLYVKGRNMTVRQLVGTVQANELSPEEAVSDLDLPVEAIREALEYAEQNEELLRLETEIEALLLKRGKARGSTAVPR